MVPSSTPLRAWAALTALVALASLVLQYVLLLRVAGVGEGVAAATLRFFGYFTILSNIAVVGVGLVRASGSNSGLAGPGPRTAVALYIDITGLVYVLVLRTLWHPQGWQWWADSGLHYAVPVMYVLGWVLGPHGGLRWPSLGLALLFPVGYLCWALLLGHWTGHYPYPFLDNAVLGTGPVLRNALWVALAFVAVGALLWKIDADLATRRGNP